MMKRIYTERGPAAHEAGGGAKERASGKGARFHESRHKAAGRAVQRLYAAVHALDPSPLNRQLQRKNALRGTASGIPDLKRWELA